MKKIKNFFYYFLTARKKHFFKYILTLIFTINLENVNLHFYILKKCKYIIFEKYNLFSLSEIIYLTSS